MRHLDLFSGIGGFAVAVDYVWPGSAHVFCDNDPFCQSVIRKHWPLSPIFSDIAKVNNYRLPYEIDILTGGFPCQPFSQAGRRKGTADDRHLWPEMLRVVRDVRPSWVVGENVSGLVTWDGGMVFEQVCIDLEEAGYEVWPFVIPACAVGAPHQRSRVWIVAHAKGKLWNGSGNTGDRRQEPSDRPVAASNADRNGLQKPRTKQQANRNRQFDETAWNADWLEVATKLCAMDDGLSDRMARPRGWRNAALKAAGNAIVPQVAVQLMEAIRNNN